MIVLTLKVSRISADRFVIALIFKLNFRMTSISRFRIMMAHLVFLILLARAELLFWLWISIDRFVIALIFKLNVPMTSNSRFRIMKAHLGFLFCWREQTRPLKIIVLTSKLTSIKILNFQNIRACKRTWSYLVWFWIYCRFRYFGILHFTGCSPKRKSVA